MFKTSLYFIFISTLINMIDTNRLDSFIMNIESSDKLQKTPVDLMTNLNENLYIEQNNTLILSCTATGDSIYVTIMKDEKEIINRTSLKDGTRNEKFTEEYRKKYINCYDAGKYKCRSGNKFGTQEITRTIIVKCPVLPSRFKSNNVHLMRGNSDFMFICDKHKDVNQVVPYVVSIRSMYGKTLNSTNVMSTTNFTFNYVTCEDMGTYRCETRTHTSNHSTETDLFVHYCPPLPTHTEETVEVDIGNSLYFTINATMSERMHTLNVIYHTYSQTNNKCGHKLCVVKFTINKWLKQLNITIKNITQQDFGNQTVKFCSENDKVNYCSDFYLNIVPKHNCATNVKILTDRSPGSLTVNWTSDAPLTSFVIFFANSTGHWVTYRPDNITRTSQSQYSATLPYDDQEHTSCQIKVATNWVQDPDKCTSIAYCPSASDTKTAASIAPSSTFDYYIIAIVVACVFILTTVVLLAMLVKHRGKKWLKASLKGKSNSYIQGDARVDRQDININEFSQRTGSNTYQPNVLENNMDHTTSRTENGHKTTTEEVSYTSMGNTQVIKKTERTVIEEVTETVEIVNLDYSNNMNMTADEEVPNYTDHTYNNVIYETA